MSLFRRKPRGVVKRDPGKAAPDDRIYGRHYRGPAPWVIGLFVAILIAAASYLAFAKEIPFTSKGYKVKATFENAATLRSTSPVRIAGVNVGEVTSVESAGRRRRGHLHGQRGGAADPHGRDDRDPPAALPRGQLLPRRQPRQPERARARRAAARSRSPRPRPRSSSTRS